MDISEKHQDSKLVSYWDDLTGGTTGQYKEKVMIDLLDKYQPQAERLLDVGCGTCDIILRYQKKLNSRDVTFLDYDAKIIEQMKKEYPDPAINWHVADIFKIADWSEKYDLVFFLDMLHEIYSFYGRPDRDIETPVDHALGQKFVKEAVANVARLVNPGGGVFITDNVICEDDVALRVKLKTPEIVELITYFLENYPTKALGASIEGDILSIGSQSFCTLLTQYNKLKIEGHDRWKVERLETHQYMTPSEYEKMFKDLGFQTHIVLGTSKVVMDEWNADFEIIEGMETFTEKRVTLLAVKQ